MGVFEPPPSSSAASPREAAREVLVLTGAIVPSDVQALCADFRGWLETNEAVVIDCDVSGLAEIDITTVDAIARLALTAHQAGRQLRFRAPPDRLKELIALVGLSEVTPCVDTSSGPGSGGPGIQSGFQTRREPEKGEEPLRVQEERDPADPSA